MCLIPTYKEALSYVKCHTFDPVAHLLEFVETVVDKPPWLRVHNIHFSWVTFWIEPDCLSWRIGILDVEFDDEAAKNTGDDQLHCLIQKHAALYKPYVDRNVAPYLVQIFIEDDQFEVPCECKV